MSNDLSPLSQERMFGDLPRKGDPTPDIKTHGRRMSCI